MCLSMKKWVLFHWSWWCRSSHNTFTSSWGKRIFLKFCKMFFSCGRVLFHTQRNQNLSRCSITIINTWWNFFLVLKSYINYNAFPPSHLITQIVPFCFKSLATIRRVNHWSRLPRQVVKSPALEFSRCNLVQNWATWSDLSINAGLSRKLG